MATHPFIHLSVSAAAFLAIAHSAMAATPPEAPDRLLMDLLSEPLAIESANPVMGWVVNDPSPGARQRAYQIRVADRDDGKDVVWDSGKIPSAESSNVRYAGPALAPNHGYHWQVRTWNPADQASPWSQPQSFTTAVKDRWLAKSIWGKSRQPGGANDTFVFLRKSFDLPDKKIAHALAHVTALSPEPANQYVYQLQLNGGFVGVGPPRSYVPGKIIPVKTPPSTRTDGVMNRYNTFDVTGMLQPGRQNVVGALCHTTDDKRFLFQMTICFTDGTRQTIVSDETWQALPAGNTIIKDQGNIATWAYRAPREGIDARRFPFGWDNAGFDAMAWQPAAIDEPISKLAASPTPNTRQYAHAPKSVVKTAEGHYFIDFGKNRVAGLRLDLDGIDGQEVEIRLGEELSAPGTVMYKMRTGNVYQDVWTLKGGRQTLQHWGYRVFRYAELLNVPGPFDASRIHAMELRQPFDDEASSFESSDRVLNDVWDLCKYTIKAHALDMYVDTHTRERINYEGGIFTEQLSSYTVHGEYAFPRFSIEHPYHRPAWPTEGKQNSVMMAWRDCLYTGNFTSLAKHYDLLKTKTLEKYLNKDFLVEKAKDAEGQHGPFGGDMVDWPLSELDRFQFTSINTVINAFNYQAVADLAEIARVLGKPQDAARYSELAAKLLNAINTHLYDPAVGKFKDGLHATNHSIHANAIPLSLGLVDPAHRESVADFVASRGMVGSVYLSQFVLDALYQNHRAEAALGIMNSTGLRSWGHMIYKLNATMTGEAWDPSIKKNMSFSHPWATSPANVIPRGLFGIIPLEHGFTRFQIKPQPASLEWAKLVTPSIKGPIRVAFQQSGDHFEMTASIPANSTASVHLPFPPGAKATLNGHAVEGTIREGFLIIEQVPSGDHRFQITRPVGR